METPLLSDADEQALQVKNLKYSPANTPTWRSAKRGQTFGDDREWAKDNWWTPLYAVIPNMVMFAVWIPLNLSILALVAWPLVIAYVKGFADAQTITFGAFAYFLVRTIILYLEPDSDPQDDLPPKKKKMVAVIGAGPSGLAVAKELLAEGHTPVVFERDAAVGGAWRTGCGCSSGRGRVLPFTITSSSALNTCYSDFPIQAENPGHDPFHMHQTDYMDYVQRYASYFDVERHCHFGQEVVSMEQIKNNRWIVKTKKVGQEEVVVQEFDAVAVCSGQVNVPRSKFLLSVFIHLYIMVCTLVTIRSSNSPFSRCETVPTIAGHQNFGGKIVHVSALSGDDPLAEFQGKRVLCVGAGETASDVTLELTKVVSKLGISVRNPVLVLPRNLWGVPPDYVETRSMYLCARWVRWATYASSIVFMFFWNNAWARNHNGKTIWIPSVTWIWKLLFTPKYFIECLRGQRSMFASCLITKSDHLLYALEKTDITKLHGGVNHIDDEGNVIFDCGSTEEYDVILLVTGYNLSSYPFLPEGYKHNCRTGRYLGTFDPSLPNVAFIGFVRGSVGSLILGFEMQARWFALLCSEKRELPDIRSMYKRISSDKMWNICWTATAGSYFFANHLARHHVKCEPNFVRFFFKYPIAAIKAYCGNFTSYQFRMRGPHADPQAVVDGYALTDGIYYIPIGFHALHLIFALQAPFFELWSRIPIMGHYFRPHTSNWY